MIIETLRVAGFDSAIHAMRNPMDSWKMSDSHWLYHDDNSELKYVIGEKDKDLSVRLQKAGPEHCKHLRMIYVWADITMPRYWWQEADTYRFGVDKVSCSTMHKLMSRKLTEDDFEVDDKHRYGFSAIVEYLNDLIDEYSDEENMDNQKAIWRHLVQMLPQSYLQKRTVCLSYAALRNIVKQREGHKLKEWQFFIDWVHTLPNSWMIFE